MNLTWTMLVLRDSCYFGYRIRKSVEGLLETEEPVLKIKLEAAGTCGQGLWLVSAPCWYHLILWPFQLHNPNENPWMRIHNFLISYWAAEPEFPEKRDAEQMETMIPLSRNGKRDTLSASTMNAALTSVLPEYKFIHDSAVVHPDAVLGEVIAPCQSTSKNEMITLHFYEKQAIV